MCCLSTVEKYRPQLNVDKVATGEHWYGQDALDLNLVDKLQTSDEYLLALLPQHDVYVINTRKKQLWVKIRFTSSSNGR